MTTTVDIHNTALDGEPRLVLHTDAHSIAGALRIVSRNAGGPVGPHVRDRIERDHGGVITIGQVTADIRVYA